MAVFGVALCADADWIERRYIASQRARLAGRERVEQSRAVHAVTRAVGLFLQQAQDNVSSGLSFRLSAATLFFVCDSRAASPPFLCRACC